MLFKSLLLRLLPLLASLFICAAQASFMADVTGTIRVIVDRAPIRADYPDGRIIDVVERGTVLSVASMRGDGRGMWIDVSYWKSDREYRGCVDSRFTSFDEDFRAGRLKQPRR